MAPALIKKDQAGDPGVPPKKPRGPLINILENNPLNRGGGGATVNGQRAGDDDDSAADTGTTGKRPLRDLVKRFTGGGAQDADDNEEGDDGGADSEGGQRGRRRIEPLPPARSLPTALPSVVENAPQKGGPTNAHKAAVTVPP